LGFEDLLANSARMDIGDGIHVRVLNLETLIAQKEELAGEKDRVVLPILRRTLAEKKRSGGA
jgi:predicted nucleotidyltransferase